MSAPAAAALEEARSLFTRGLAAHAAGELPAAEQHFRAALALAPDRVSILGNLGAVLCAQGRHAEARPLVERALQIDPDNADACMTLGACLERSGETAAALERFSRVCSLRPADAEAWASRASALATLARYDEALAACERTLALRREAPDLYRHAFVLKDLGRYDEALAGVLQALRLQPGQADYLLLQGLLLQRMHRYDEAAAVLRPALAAAPDNAQGWLLLAGSLQETKHFDEALQATGRALALREDSEKAWHLKGTLLQNTGDYEGAHACFERAIRINPAAVMSIAAQAALYVAKPRSQAHSIAQSVASLEAYLEHEYRPEAIVKARTDAHGALAIPLFRIKHDLQQGRYLESRGYAPQGFGAFAEVGQRLLDEAAARAVDENRLRVSRAELEALAPYWRAPLLYRMPEDLDCCINPDNDWRAIEETYLAGSPEVVRIDNFLCPQALAAFREYALVSKVWHAEYPDKYLGAFANRGFISPLHLALAEELRRAMPRVFLDYGLTQLWGFKYDSTLGKGINVHADFAKVNLNFWITPDENNLAPEAGGLRLFDVPSPQDWSFYDFNVNKKKIYDFLDRHQSRDRAIVVPHGCNRAVLFNSALFHETDRLQFREGYETRRVNITYLFGKQL